MGMPRPQSPSVPVDRSSFIVAGRVLRRLLRLHGSAVGNAAASVRADDVARDARHRASEAVVLSTERTRETSR
jgi:hypothetical protein